MSYNLYLSDDDSEEDLDFDKEFDDVDSHGTHYKLCGGCHFPRDKCTAFKLRGYDCLLIRPKTIGNFLTFERAPCDTHYAKAYAKGPCRCTRSCYCKKELCCIIL